ncbi:MAG: hypothetical protein R3A51_16280 [Nannocystaceae bacterium]|nr:hypothetical protein [Myxococcales bacterium]
MRRRLALLLGVGVLALLLLLARDLATLYLRHAIASAANEEDEREALCRANRWVHAGFTKTYSVECEDAEGGELRPWQDGAYDRVAVVRLRWTNGVSVERRLISTKPLDCVFGE